MAINFAASRFATTKFVATGFDETNEQNMIINIINMIEKINMKKRKTNNNVPKSNTLRSYNTNSPNTCNSNI